MHGGVKDGIKLRFAAIVAQRGVAFSSLPPRPDPRWGVGAGAQGDATIVEPSGGSAPPTGLRRSAGSRPTRRRRSLRRGEPRDARDGPLGFTLLRPCLPRMFITALTSQPGDCSSFRFPTRNSCHRGDSIGDDPPCPLPAGSDASGGGADAAGCRSESVCPLRTNSGVASEQLRFLKSIWEPCARHPLGSDTAKSHSRCCPSVAVSAQDGEVQPRRIFMLAENVYDDVAFNAVKAHRFPRSLGRSLFVPYALKTFCTRSGSTGARLRR